MALVVDMLVLLDMQQIMKNVHCLEGVRLIPNGHGTGGMYRQGKNGGGGGSHGKLLFFNIVLLMCLIAMRLTSHILAVESSH